NRVLIQRFLLRSGDPVVLGYIRVLLLYGLLCNGQRTGVPFAVLGEGEPDKRPLLRCLLGDQRNQVQGAYITVQAPVTASQRDVIVDGQQTSDDRGVPVHDIDRWQLGLDGRGPQRREQLQDLTDALRFGLDLCWVA